MEVFIKILLAYLLGSIVGSLLLGRLRGVDIRTQGSGNAGGTNALRTQGKAFALGTVIIDIAKGWVAAAWLPSLALPGIAAAAPSAREWLPVACAFAAICGHVWPLWHGFRGGKGAATLVGALAGLQPWLLVPVLVVWLLLVVAVGFVGLASIGAAIALPIYLGVTGASNQPLLVFALAVAVLVVVTHRGNIARMRAGTEPRARRLWLLGRNGG